MTTVPVPRFDLLKMNDYAVGSIQFSRGCPFIASSATSSWLLAESRASRSSLQVIAELEALLASGMDTAFIVDDNLIGNKKAMKEVLRDVVAWQTLNGYPMTFVTEASIDLADDDELMQLMVDANIRRRVHRY